MRFMKGLKLLLIAPLLALQTSAYAAASDQADDEIAYFLNRLYTDRAALFLAGTPESIANYYLEGSLASREARNQELRRSLYVKTWAAKRGVNLSAAESSIRITRIRKDGGTAKVSLAQSLKLAYRYPKWPDVSQEFGIGTIHGVTLKKTAGEWQVASEWYSDPLDVEPNLVPEESPPLTPREAAATAPGKRYDRMRAIAYADKYAGSTWGAGNNHRYNRKYIDYTYLGGDCTNYVSQVLGDPAEGGGLKMTDNWRYHTVSGGSTPWVQTDRLKNFLLYSGYGRLVAKGTYPEVVKSTSKHPAGAIGRLQLGDLIADEVKGDVDHFSIITGFDAMGYPLVNSHSADRYHVPFDLGWENYTKFLLIHIKD